MTTVAMTSSARNKPLQKNIRRMITFFKSKINQIVNKSGYFLLMGEHILKNMERRVPL